MTTSTGFSVNNQDLSEIFQAYVSGDKAEATGFYTLVNDTSTDLNAVFQKYDGTSETAPTTNMIALNGLDLNQVFNKIGGSPPSYDYTATGNYFESSTQDATGVVFYVPYGVASGTSGTITFTQDAPVNLIMVGGGAGGGNGSTYASQYNWTGYGGGGGGFITTPITLKSGTQYNIFVGHGGTGGVDATSGTNSIFSTSDNTTKYTAYGGTIASPSLTNGFINSSGGGATINSGSGPVGFTGSGGGGGGSSTQYVNKKAPTAQSTYGTGGTGGSYNNSGVNPGQAGSPAKYVNSFAYGGTGGSSYQVTVPTPFYSASPAVMPVGGGGAGSSVGGTDGSVSTLYQGNAGYGIGGLNSSVQQGAYTNCNANNNSYTKYTLSGNSTTVPGPTGIAAGYGAGGGGNISPYGAGFGGNGVVIFWWYNP